MGESSDGLSSIATRGKYPSDYSGLLVTYGEPCSRQNDFSVMFAYACTYASIDSVVVVGCTNLLIHTHTHTRTRVHTDPRHPIEI